MYCRIDFTLSNDLKIIQFSLLLMELSQVQISNSRNSAPEFMVARIGLVLKSFLHTNLLAYMQNRIRRPI